MHYFLTVILPAKTTAAKLKSFTANLEKILKVFEGKIVKTDNMGQVDLQKKIAGNTSGNFINFELELKPSAAKGLRDKMVTQEDILRYLLIRKD